MDGTKPSPGGGPGSEGVLANFFNSLLSKKTGTPTPAKSGNVLYYPLAVAYPFVYVKL